MSNAQAAVAPFPGSAALLRVTDLRTSFYTREGVIRAVDGVDLSLSQGETLGIVGESGSGKSVTALSILGLVAPPGRVEPGSTVLFDNRDLTTLREKDLRAVRGGDIGMIFQEPMSSLNPVLSVGAQIVEALRLHKSVSRRVARRRATELLHMVGIPSSARRMDDYPHQLSGGMRQRVMIAMAIACEPKLLVADEPTTALDATVQAQILSLLGDLRDRLGMAMVLITHDFGVISEVADSVAVMYAGRVVERGPADDLLRDAQHPYTAALLRSIPRIGMSQAARLKVIPGAVPNALHWPRGCRFAPRCDFVFAKCLEQEPPLLKAGPQDAACWLCADGPRETTRVNDSPAEASGSAPAAIGSQEVLIAASELRTYFPVKRGILKRTVAHVKAVDGVDFEVKVGETLGLVGESGCGKSTLGRTLLRLVDPVSGTIHFAGQDITALRASATRTLRRDMQIIFQDPVGSLNPRMKVGEIVAEGLKVQRIARRGERAEKVAEILSRVGLHPDVAHRYPHEFSGGQRQRIGIARALVLQPKLVIADEPISALDVSIQSQVLNLLVELKQEFDLTYVFIAHDLAVVGYISDRVAVMYLGKIVEIGSTASLFAKPLHPYTVALLSAVPDPEQQRDRRGRPLVLPGDVPSPITPPSGCRFHTRCPIAQPICSQVEPALEERDGAHRAACHFAGDLTV